MNDYFVEQPKFNEKVFCERFRMRKTLFLKIVGDIEAQFKWFISIDRYGVVNK